MVSRSNLSGRGPYGGVLGRAYKGPSGPGNVTPPGMEKPARGIGERVREAQDSVAAQRPGQGLLAQAKRAAQQRKAQVGSVQAKKRGGIGGMVRSALEQQQAQQAALSPPVDTTQVGLVDSLGEAAVNPVAPRPVVPPPEVGGNVSRGTPTRAGSAASRSRRNIR